jgi:LPS O-antigen subunit length determinant protein (WzzB/FepE family)
MQDTRFNNLISGTSDRLSAWLQNPWRRWSVILISLLLGFYLGTAVSTVAGQRATLDIVIAAVLVAMVEGVSFLTYRQGLGGRSFPLSVTNALKIGLTYSLFVDAFKLGS